jgi:hypothetical protein
MIENVSYYTAWTQSGHEEIKSVYVGAGIEGQPCEKGRKGGKLGVISLPQNKSRGREISVKLSYLNLSQSRVQWKADQGTHQGI